MSTLVKLKIKLILAAAMGAVAVLFVLLLAVVMPSTAMPAILKTANELDTVPLELRGMFEAEANRVGADWYDLAGYVGVVYQWKLPIPTMDQIGREHDGEGPGGGPITFEMAIRFWEVNARAWIRAQLAAGNVLERVPAERWKEFRNLRDAIHFVAEARKLDADGWRESTGDESHQIVLAIRDWFSYRCPVAGATFTNDWGFDRPQNVGYAPPRHQGTDLFAPVGTPIRAGFRGVVHDRGWNYLGGRTVTVEDFSGALFYYAHMQGYGDIAKGDEVHSGTILGYVGTSGEGPDPTDNVIGQSHLHLGIYLPEGATNPFPYVSVWCGKS